MLFDKNQIDVIGDYIQTTYSDPCAKLRLETFFGGFALGWKNAIEHSAHYVNGWHSNMDSLHEGVTKGLLSEVEGGIRGLEFGDV